MWSTADRRRLRTRAVAWRASSPRRHATARSIHTSERTMCGLRSAARGCPARSPFAFTHTARVHARTAARHSHAHRSAHLRPVPSRTGSEGGLCGRHGHRMAVAAQRRLGRAVRRQHLVLQRVAPRPLTPAHTRARRRRSAGHRTAPDRGEAVVRQHGADEHAVRRRRRHRPVEPHGRTVLRGQLDGGRCLRCLLVVRDASCPLSRSRRLQMGPEGKLRDA